MWRYFILRGGSIIGRVKLPIRWFHILTRDGKYITHKNIDDKPYANYRTKPHLEAFVEREGTMIESKEYMELLWQSLYGEEEES